MRVVVLGSSGGPFESNLSSYWVGPNEGSYFVAMDAGVLLSGLRHAIQQGAFNDLTFTPEEGEILSALFYQRLKAYFVSHAHLDHVAGLVINSQSDHSKTIFATDFTMDNLRDHLFNGQVWARSFYGDEGQNNGFYRFVRLPLHAAQAIPNTEMQVEAFALSHQKEYFSSAFLLELKGEYLLYCGDTGSDVTENSHLLDLLWRRIAPLIEQKVLKGIFLECSYPTNLPANKKSLYGHFNPPELMQEMHKLADKVNPDRTREPLSGLKVFITHIKDRLTDTQINREEIASQLESLNTLGIKFHYPLPGETYFL